ncbi:MAG: hypothetical protein JNK72_10370 [Myxococcales bacterium]|nr:hypothetical protein [Myxococcales bacterium]
MIDYDPHRWRDHFFDIRGSMVKSIGYRSLTVTFFATLVALVDHHWIRMATTEKVHGLVGPALSLLLVFRTNASYDRFWEARKLWGSIVNETRNYVRGAKVYFGHDAALFARAVHWAVAFPYATMNHLRGAQGLGPVGAELGAAGRDAETARHPPLAVAVAMSRVLDDARRAGHLDSVQQSSVDQNVQLLIDCVGACERIRKTPLPFAYVVHLRRALLLYCATLPFALLPFFGWGCIFITFLVAFVLLGIEEIGVEIEEPFGTDDNDLPLETLCASIEATLRTLLPPPRDPT